MIKTLLLAAALAFSAQAGAQAAAPGKKKALAAQIVQAQQGGIDQMARQVVEQPALQLMQRAGMVIQSRFEADKREAVARDVQGEVRKYAEETFPIVRDRARALAPDALVPLLEAKLSEAELQEVLAVFQSQAWRKYQALAPEMQKALGEKLVADVKPQLEPRLKTLDRTLADRLGLGGGGAAAAPAAPAAAAPSTAK
ncbi:MAG: hypothetical protein HYZ20_14720 [Burkholderiales bacterium]|nr:hypothetical protein [Burkholderiales bacterium]